VEKNEVSCAAYAFYDARPGQAVGARSGGNGWFHPGWSRRIFMSYRREETAAYLTGWSYDRLAGRDGDGQVLKDVDSIQLGDDFVEQRQRAPPEWWAMRDSNPGIFLLVSLAIYMVDISSLMPQ
jgi:hypothetical protein